MQIIKHANLRLVFFLSHLWCIMPRWQPEFEPPFLRPSLSVLLLALSSKNLLRERGRRLLPPSQLLRIACSSAFSAIVAW